MIVLSIVSLLFSFLLQGLWFKFIPYTIDSLSILCTSFVLINLVILQEYYEDSKKFCIFIIVLGLLVDIVYNGIAFLSLLIFIIIYYIIRRLYYIFPYNYLTVNLFSLLAIIIYNILTFLFLIVVGYDNYSLLVLLKIIGCNIIMTIIYTSLLYYVIGLLVKKFELRVIR